MDGGGETVNIKKWTVFYPVYINSKKTVADGRRISLTNACENPTCVEISDCCAHLKLPNAVEVRAFCFCSFHFALFYGLVLLFIFFFIFFFHILFFSMLLTGLKVFESVADGSTGFCNFLWVLIVFDSLRVLVADR